MHGPQPVLIVEERQVPDHQHHRSRRDRRGTSRRRCDTIDPGGAAGTDDPNPAIEARKEAIDVPDRHAIAHNQRRIRRQHLGKIEGSTPLERNVECGNRFAQGNGSDLVGGDPQLAPGRVYPAGRVQLRRERAAQQLGIRADRGPLQRVGVAPTGSPSRGVINHELAEALDRSKPDVERLRGRLSTEAKHHLRRSTRGELRLPSQRVGTLDHQRAIVLPGSEA